MCAPSAISDNHEAGYGVTTRRNRTCRVALDVRFEERIAKRNTYGMAHEIMTMQVKDMVEQRPRPKQISAS
jgi:hypothetical protein